MLKKLSLCLLFLVFTVFIFGQTYLTQFRHPYGAEWGFISSNGTILLEPKFNGIFNFSEEEGLAPVYVDKTNKWSYVDINGVELSITLKNWEPAHIFGHGREGFQSGIARVKVKRKYGCIGTNGLTVYEPIYDFISPFINGIATAKLDDEFFILKNSGERQKLDIPIIEIRRFSEGLARFKGANKSFGLINPKGEIIAEPHFFSIGHFYSGLAWAKNLEEKVGFIDQNGTWVIEPKYLAAKNFDPISGIARVKIDDTWKYISKTGEELIISDPPIRSDFQEGFAYSRKGDKFGFIDAKGEWIVKPIYDKVKKFENGMAAVRSGDFWGYVNDKGVEVIEPQFENVLNFKHGFAPASPQRERWGIIDKTGKWLVEPIYGRMKEMQKVP